MAMSAADRRKAQNKGIAPGTVRKGAKGNYMRRYNAKTGRWDIVGATQKTAKKFMREKGETLMRRSASTPSSKKTGSRTATAATVSSAIARGNTQGPSRPSATTKGELPTSSMNKAALIRRISAIEKQLSNVRTRQTVSSGLAANRAQSQKDIARLEAELKRLKGKK